MGDGAEQEGGGGARATGLVSRALRHGGRHGGATALGGGRREQARPHQAPHEEGRPKVSTLITCDGRPKVSTLMTGEGRPKVSLMTGEGRPKVRLMTRFGLPKVSLTTCVCYISIRMSVYCPT